MNSDMVMFKPRRLWIRLLQIALIAALIVFIGQRIASNWTSIKDFDWHLNYGFMALSLLVMLLALFVQSSVLAKIFGAFARDVSVFKSFKIAYLSQLGRYLPGKVWQVFGMIHLSGKEGVSKTEAISSFALAQLFTTPPALLVVACFLFLPGYYPDSEFVSPTIGYIVGAVSCVCLVILFKPQWLRKVINAMVTRLGSSPVEFHISRRAAVEILAMYCVGWILYGTAFYFFLLSVSEFPGESILQAIGIFCAAYLIGYWSILAPGGIGVRETALVLFLGPIFGGGVAAAIAAFARIWSIVGEVIASIIAVRIR
jgi:uncharacterized membrane protein YbhN (UPF0104 family)